MPKQVRHKTNYPGVYYINGTTSGTQKIERIFYIMYRKDGKLVEEKAGRQFQDNMTAARASSLRTLRMKGNLPTNKDSRIKKKNEKTINQIWELYKEQKFYLKGIKFDNNRYTKHIQQQFGNLLSSEITPYDVDTFRTKIMKTNSTGTVKNVLELLRRIINYGVSKKYSNPLDFKIEFPRVYSQKTEDLNSEQLNKLMKTLEEDNDIQATNFIKMVLFTGMRRGELFRLKWENIDFNRGFIKIVDPKGGKDQEIPLNNATRELLQNHPHSESEYVFPGKNGKQRVDIKKAVNRIKKQAELPKDFRPLHGLRHVYASMLASSGEVDMYTLQKLLTHKSPQMTQRYAHLRDDALKKASNLAGEMIRKISKE
ncbi:MAG: site-specific integrase [Candidatus Latescibacteria bacterium]|nr:site-specific integrase [Candidatus Latescibacterota bacterium]